MQTENRMGAFICDMRKKKNLTQKQLAEQLSVTDKAISKWERGMGYPDITLLTKLAACLDVTTNELLSGVRPETEPEPEPEALVQYTLEYADVITEDKTTRRLRAVGIILSLSLLTAAVICMICNLSISGRFTWVIFPVSSMMFSWLFLMPLFWFRRQRLALCLLSTSIFILPFLLVLCQALNGNWFFPVAVPCALAGLAWLWVIYLTAVGSKSGWFAGGVAFLCTPLVDLCVDVAVARYTGQPPFDGWMLVEVIFCLVLAAVLFSIGKMKRRSA